jgi:hypothetical protein
MVVLAKILAPLNARAVSLGGKALEVRLREMPVQSRCGAPFESGQKPAVLLRFPSDSSSLLNE